MCPQSTQDTPQAEAARNAVITQLRKHFAPLGGAPTAPLVIVVVNNGGGRISTANHLASQIVGALHGGKVFTSLVYNAAHQSANTSFTMATVPGSAFSRVVVITGPRTCSASELIVNGLSPYAQVVTVGGTSCGKPYGFSPVESCGNVFSVVNFRSTNALGQANYDAGIAPTCAVADTFTGTLDGNYDPAQQAFVNGTLTAMGTSFTGNGTWDASYLGP